MTNVLRVLRQFALSPEHTRHLQNDYHRVPHDFQLWNSKELRAVATKFKDRAGIYVWVLSHDGQEHRIYVGKTKSIGNRIKAYAGVFQPHSPNDFKLQAFYSLAEREFPGSKLGMYFSPCDDVNELTKRENEEIKFFSPLLNPQMKPGDQARRSFQEAFVAYYQSGIEAALLAASYSLKEVTDTVAS